MNITLAHDDLKKAENKEFWVTACGYYCDIDQDTSCIRPDGRDDYLFACVLNGKMRFVIDNKEHILKPGNIIIYKPNEPQNYSCDSCDNSAYYWVHFKGIFVNSLLKSCNFSDKHIYYADVDFNDLELIYKMISEINNGFMFYQTNLLSYFSKLLVNVSRRSCPEYKENHIKNYLKLKPALDAVQNQLNISYTIDEYAKMCNLSKYYFQHLFKEYTKRSLVSYRTEIALKRAANLLSDTTLSITEIANAVGFSDSLYFCKKFKEYFKLSPKNYRNK